MDLICTEVWINDFSSYLAFSSDGVPSDTTINDLNDDCLISIFSRLPVTDRIRIERVSPTWKDLAEKSWSGVKSLDLNDVAKLLNPSTKFHSMRSIDSDIIRKILKKYGKYLRKIRFVQNDYCILDLVADYCPNITSIVMDLTSAKGVNSLSYKCKEIQEFKCANLAESSKFVDMTNEEWNLALARLFVSNKKLKVLELIETPYYFDFGYLLALTATKVQSISTELKEYIDPGIPVNYRIPNLAKISNNLTFLKLDLSIFAQALLYDLWKSGIKTITFLKIDCSLVNDNVEELLGYIFKNNRNIKTLQVKAKGKEIFTGKCTLDLNKDVIEEIRIMDCNPKFESCLAKSLPTFVNLHTLDVSIDSELAITCIASLGTRLKILLVHTTLTYTKNFAEAISALKNLEVLSLEGSDHSNLGKNFFDLVAPNLLHIKYLSVRGFKDVFESGIASINKFEKLEELYVDSSSCKNSVRAAIACLRHLKILYLEERVYTKGSEDFKALLKCAGNLQHFKVFKLGHSCHEIVETAIQETKNRKNNVMLEISLPPADKYKISWDLIQEISPLLRINFDPIL